MDLRKGGGKNSVANTAGSGISGEREEPIEGSSSASNTGPLSQDIAKIHVTSMQDGDWEVIGKKNRAAPVAGKTLGPSAAAPKSDNLPRQGRGTNSGAGRASGGNWAQPGNGGAGRASGGNWAQPGNGGAGRGTGNRWANAVNHGGTVRAPVNNCVQAADSRRPMGWGSSKPQPTPRTLGSGYMAPPPTAVSPALQHGWQWASSSGPSGSQAKEENFSSRTQGGFVNDYDSQSEIVDSQSDNDELVEGSDDDLSDDYDSDASQKSHETRKKNKWFKGFFEALDKMTVEEINASTRQWHCPACQNGPGAIDWYTGLQPLITHAKTKGAKRAQLHRELSKLLDEELRRRGTSVIPAGEAFGKWKGLRETTTDHEIVWPPMVIVMNTILEQVENEKWIGMGNQELLDYFNTYQAAKARHSYGPLGHRGMSVLIFEPSAVGYLEAERLHKHFAEQGTDRDAWERRRVLFYPGGKRQLYGYLATKEDMGVFNQHCQGKSRLKFEMKSHQEMVVIPMKQMSEDNQQLLWLKNRVVKQERRSKTLEETLGCVSQKLRETMEESRIVRLRTKMQYEENKEEMDSQEKLYKEQLDQLQKDMEEKERKYEILLEERAMAKQSDLNSGSNEEQTQRKEEMEEFIVNQEKDFEEFAAEKAQLLRAHEERKLELKRKYQVDVVELEKELGTALSKLMEKYA